jgi:hypothetical protein
MSCVSDGIVQGTIAYNDSLTTATFTPNCSLGHGTAYVADIAAGGVLTGAKAWQFTTIEESPDSDDDGVHDGEDDHPHDRGKASPPNPKGNGKWQIDASANTGAYLAEVAAISDTSARITQSGKPVGYEFRDGMVSYKLEGVPVGGTATVTVTSPSGIPAGSKVYKADAVGFHEIANAVVNGDTVTLTLTDGGSGDSDGQANGVIEDPVGVASPSASGSGTVGLSTDSASSGCSVAVGRSSGASGIDGFMILGALGLMGWRFWVRRNRR